MRLLLADTRARITVNRWVFTLEASLAGRPIEAALVHCPGWSTFLHAMPGGGCSCCCRLLAPPGLPLHAASWLLAAGTWAGMACMRRTKPATSVALSAAMPSLPSNHPFAPVADALLGIARQSACIYPCTLHPATSSWMVGYGSGGAATHIHSYLHCSMHVAGARHGCMLDTDMETAACCVLHSTQAATETVVVRCAALR